jgi:protein involved in polysaccharide export with SLBB domain
MPKGKSLVSAKPRRVSSLTIARKKNLQIRSPNLVSRLQSVGGLLFAVVVLVVPCGSIFAQNPAIETGANNGQRTISGPTYCVPIFPQNNYQGDQHPQDNNQAYTQNNYQGDQHPQDKNQAYTQDNNQGDVQGDYAQAFSQYQRLNIQDLNNQTNVRNDNAQTNPQSSNALGNAQAINNQGFPQNGDYTGYGQNNNAQPCPNGFQFPYQNVPGAGLPANSNIPPNFNPRIVPSPRPTDISADEPREIQQRDPYGLESLHDLYTQIPSNGGRLRRFGSDAFLLGTGNSNELPMDLPAGPDYVLGPGDNLVVNMWGGYSNRLNLTVDRQGQIALPEAGTVTLDGLTISQAQNAIQKALGQQFQGEHVEISLGRLRSVRIYVVGDVQRPGAYDVSSLSTPLSALYAAGGPTSRGSLRILRQYRGTKLVRQIDLYDFLLKGVRSDADRLLPGDTLLIPPVGPQVTVEGMVHRPAIYELNGEQTLNQVLDLAGGVLITGSLKQINVERVETNQKRSMLSLDLPDNQEIAEKEIAGFHVQGGDDVVISQILPYNQQAVYLEGHVFRPGKYPYYEGMTINDLLHSYQDVMPEPADHAELVRLQPPDFRPEAISLNLPDVLMGNDPIKLQPYDLVRVFSRYEADAPTVSIRGEVLHPGIYPLSEGMRVTDLVRIAGDFNRSAYRDVADLSSYTVVGGQSVMINHSEINLKVAMAGDKTADVVLKPGDTLSIDQLSGWINIGASVTITGETLHPGSYGIVPGERLSSILKRAGGFLSDAYPQAATLERVQVRSLAEQARQQMILRVESTSTQFNSATMSQQDLTAKQQSVDMQKEQVLARLRNSPASGRLVINISGDISKWEGTSVDIEMRPGDALHIPKLTNFVSVNGLVYNTVAISFVPGRDAGWYLTKAGGVASGGDKRAIYVIRADGSVVAHEKSWISNTVLNIRMRPGDTIIVPEKIITGSETFKDIIAAAQAFSTIALAAAAAGAF